MGLTALLSLRRKASCGILLPLKSISSAGFKPANLGSNGKHANHYTTEATTCNRQSASKHQRDRIFTSLAERASSAQFVYCRWRGWFIDWLIELTVWSCRWGETSQNRGHQLAYCSSPGWHVSVESHGDDDNDAGCGNLLTRPPELSGNPTSTDIWERIEGMDEGLRILRLPSIETRRPVWSQTLYWLTLYIFMSRCTPFRPWMHSCVAQGIIKFLLVLIPGRSKVSAQGCKIYW
jgi:hypothetical protein